MMGFTADGQANEGLVEARDHRLGVSSSERRQKRADIPMPTLVRGANWWETGRTVQTRLVEMDFRR